MSKVSGAAPERSRHRGANRFHPIDIDVQLLGLEMMELRQYRQTWVKGTIGLGSQSETKVAQDARTSGGRWFTGRSEFFKESISRRTALACFSRASTCEMYCQPPRFPFGSLDRTSEANVATRTRDIGGIADCTRAHSVQNFLLNALMSCSRESSRVASGMMMVGVQGTGGDLEST